MCAKCHLWAIYLTASFPCNHKEQNISPCREVYVRAGGSEEEEGREPGVGLVRSRCPSLDPRAWRYVWKLHTDHFRCTAWLIQLHVKNLLYCDFSPRLGFLRSAGCLSWQQQCNWHCNSARNQVPVWHEIAAAKRAKYFEQISCGPLLD